MVGNVLEKSTINNNVESMNNSLKKNTLATIISLKKQLNTNNTLVKPKILYRVPWISHGIIGF